MRYNKILKLILLALVLALVVILLFRFSSNPVIRTNAPYPTETKTQSKLWFAHGFWWVWLPFDQGSAIWKKGDTEWKRQEYLDTSLKKVSGYADIINDGNDVWAVLVGRDDLNFVHLEFDIDLNQYSLVSKPKIWPLPRLKNSSYPQFSWVDYIVDPYRRSVESATLSRDRDGNFFIVYDYDEKLWVLPSKDIMGNKWYTASCMINNCSYISEDDLGIGVNLENRFSVIWSDQKNKSYFFRSLLNINKNKIVWDDLITIESGEKKVNDHLNVAQSLDGKLFLATKSSSYIINQPVLSLKVRDKNGEWRHYSYAPLTKGHMPTRPIVVIRPNSNEGELLLINTSIDRTFLHLNKIVMTRFDVFNEKMIEKNYVLIPKTFDVRNPTSSKVIEGQETQLVILASDKFGNVYESALNY